MYYLYVILVLNYFVNSIKSEAIYSTIFLFNSLLKYNTVILVAKISAIGKDIHTPVIP